MAADMSLHLLQKVESVLAKISSSPIQQAASSLDIGVSINLQKFNDTLLSFFEDNHSLIEFDNRKAICYGVSLESMTEIKRVLDDAENMLDEIQFQWESLRRKHKQNQKLLLKAPPPPPHDTLMNKVGHFFSSLSPYSSSCPLDTQIKVITQRFQHFASKSLYRYPTRFSYLSEDSDVMVIGREIDKEIVVEKLLLMRQDDQTCLPVLPIVGMRGLGKSTLANIVFHDKRMCESFSMRIWMPVSHAVDIEEVIIRLFNSACSFDTITHSPIIRKGELTMIQLLHRLENILVGKKLLLVLDDVRRESPLKWDELINLIETGVNGSKVLLTTRSHIVASEMGTIPSHVLEPLSLKDSFFLFEKLATKAEACKYPELIEVGKNFVNRCEGIPLVIKAIGDMLFSKQSMVEWESMRHSDFRDLSQDYGILPAFKLSYNYMPSHLKQCFQLFSLYPNDFVFHSSEVVSLWATLDLLPSPNIDETLIDVSYRCLQKIIPRIFFKEFVNLGTSYYFQIYDVLLDIARDMATSECRMVNSNTQNIPRGVHHLSYVIENLFDKSFTRKYANANVRTFIFPIEGVGATSEHFLNLCLSRYKHLRILDLSDSTYEVLPSSIGKLRYLRFLSLERNKKIKRVPDSICKLQHLQVLNLAGCKELKALPKGLRNLASLRQLGITTKESILPENDIADLDSLEFLRIESCENLNSIFLMIKLFSLKTLEVIDCGNLKYLSLDIDHFPQLETLLVDNCDYLELIKGHGYQSTNLRLKAIRLHSLPQLVNLPRWLQKSTNTLQSLLIVDCKHLEMFPEWLSTFSVLGSFCIVNCPKLMSLPNDIHRLVALEYFRIEDCPEVCRKCQPHDGEYWSKISHIKRIFIGKPEDLNEEE